MAGIAFARGRWYVAPQLIETGAPMSIRVSSWLRKHTAYSGSVYAVLLALADWANDEGANVYPGIEKIAEKAHVGERATKYAIRHLERDGVIVCVFRRRGRGNKSEWRIVMDPTKWHLTSETLRSANRIAARKKGEHDKRFGRVKRCKAAIGNGANSEAEKVQIPMRGGDASILRSVIDSSEIRQKPEPITSDRNARRGEESAGAIVDRVMRSLAIKGQS